MKCTNCANIIKNTSQCHLCLSLFCSTTCLNTHYILIHSNQPPLPIKKQKKYNIPSPYIVNGILNSKIIYDELYSLKNFVEIYEDGHLKTIGSGSYGQVYLAMNIINKKYYAIKHMDKKKLLELLHTLSGIYREINIQSRIDHPSIVKLLYVKETENSFDLVMDYAVQGNLFHYIRKTKGLNENKTFCLFIQVVNAIYFLHKNNLIHRDIKPENLLLFDSNTVKLCDFGWCVPLNNGEKRGTFCGTTEYMSPELVNHKHYSKEIDVWSLGVLLYEMIHGYSAFKPNKPDFDENDVMDNIKKHKLKFRKQVTEECKELIYHLLDPDINNRYTVEDIFYSSFVKKYENKNYFIPKSNKVNKININNANTYYCGLSKANNTSRVNTMIYKTNNFSSNNIFSCYNNNNYSSINNLNNNLNNYNNEIIQNNNNGNNVYLDSNYYLDNNDINNKSANNFYPSNFEKNREQELINIYTNNNDNQYPDIDDLIINNIIFEHTFNANNQNINYNYNYFYNFDNYNQNNIYSTSSLVPNSIHNKTRSDNTTVSTKNNGNQNNFTNNNRNIINEFELNDEKNLEIQEKIPHDRVRGHSLKYNMSIKNCNMNINESILLNNKEVIDNNNKTQNINLTQNHSCKTIVKSNSFVNNKKKIPNNFLKYRGKQIPQNNIYNNKNITNTLSGKENKETYIQDILHEFGKFLKNKNSSHKSNKTDITKNVKRQTANLNNKQNSKKKKYLILKNSDVILARNEEVNDDIKETPKKNKDSLRINPKALLNCFIKEFKNFSNEEKSSRNLYRKK